MLAVLKNDLVSTCGCLKGRTIMNSRDVYCAKLDEQEDDED